MARSVVVGVLAILLIAPLLLQFPIAGLPVNSLDWWYFVVVALDCLLILCVLSFASARRLYWESFLHPRRYLGSIVGSLATIVGTVFIELGLGLALFITALASSDCTGERSYKAGTCDLHSGSAYTFDFIFGLMAITAIVACLALMRTLILVGLAVNEHERTKLT